MIRAAIFDMDGLLFDTERLCCDAWRTVSEEYGYHMRDELFFACVGRNNRDTREIVLQEMGADFPYDSFRDLARTWMTLRMTESGPPEKPGIRPLFEYLASRNIPIALATSTSEKSARWMIDRSGLSAHFSAWAFGSEVENGKPAPDIFLLALERLNALERLEGNQPACIKPAECVVFEDSSAGLSAAQAAGMRSVFIRDMIQPPPEVMVGIWKTIDHLGMAAEDSFFVDANSIR